MAKDENAYYRCLLYSSNALSRVITRLADQEFKKIGLSTSYAFLLMSVNKNPGILPSEISAAMMLTPSTVTRLIEKMEKSGLLLRQSEGKRNHVLPTHLSLELDPKIRKAWKKVYEQYTDILGEESSRKLTELTYEAASRIMNR